MSAIQHQMDIFADNSEIGLIRQDFILLHSSTEKVRRGVYAKVTAQQKQIDALKEEIEQLKQSVTLCNPLKNTRRAYCRRQQKGFQTNEEVNLDSSDLPLLQFA